MARDRSNFQGFTHTVSSALLSWLVGGEGVHQAVRAWPAGGGAMAGGSWGAALTRDLAGLLQEWADTCCRGLRSVHAYILVYDICCFDSFEYVKTIRQQILETR